jgi:hypothetical protein
MFNLEPYRAVKALEADKELVAVGAVAAMQERAAQH